MISRTRSSYSLRTCMSKSDPIPLSDANEDLHFSSVLAFTQASNCWVINSAVFNIILAARSNL